jgi:hypothetical protein
MGKRRRREYRRTAATVRNDRPAGNRAERCRWRHGGARIPARLTADRGKGSCFRSTDTSLFLGGSERRIWVRRESRAQVTCFALKVSCVAEGIDGCAAVLVPLSGTNECKFGSGNVR